MVEGKATPPSSDTPETDSMVTGNSDPTQDEYEELAYFCRTLERYLSAARKRGEELEQLLRNALQESDCMNLWVVAEIRAHLTAKETK